MSKNLAKIVESEHQLVPAPNIYAAMDSTEPGSVLAISDILEQGLPKVHLEMPYKKVCRASAIDRLGTYITGFVAYYFFKGDLNIAFLEFDKVRNISSYLEGNPVIPSKDIEDLKDLTILGGLSVSNIFPSEGTGSQWVYYRSQNPWESFLYVARTVIDQGRRQDEGMYVPLLAIFPIERVRNLERVDLTHELCRYIKWDTEDNEKRDLYLCLDKSDIIYYGNEMENNNFSREQSEVIEKVFGRHKIWERIKKLTGKNITFNFLHQNQVSKYIHEDQALITPLRFRVLMDNVCNTPTSFQMFYEVVANDSQLPVYFSRDGDFSNVVVYAKPKEQ